MNTTYLLQPTTPTSERQADVVVIGFLVLAILYFMIRELLRQRKSRK